MTDIVQRSRQDRSASLAILVGATIVAALVAIATFAPFLAPYDAMKMAAGPRLSAPSATHLFGTDEFGRDLFSRILLGARLSLGIGIAAVVSGLLVGALLGLIAAFSSRYVEIAVLRLIDVLYSFPDTLIALTLVAFLGPGMENATLAIAASLVPFYARVTYALSAGERAKPYVEAARLTGIGSTRLVRVHVMPNIGHSMIVMATIGFSSAILSAAGLSFLGLGVQPPSPEWGAILASGRNYITKAPWILIFPGLALCVTVLSFNLIGDSSRELFDPRRGRR